MQDNEAKVINKQNTDPLQYMNFNTYDYVGLFHNNTLAAIVPSGLRCPEYEFSYWLLRPSLKTNQHMSKEARPSTSNDPSMPICFLMT